MATVAKRPKKDSFGYFVDTAQGKFRIKKLADGWAVSSYSYPTVYKFRTLTDAVTHIEEGWHLLCSSKY